MNKKQIKQLNKIFKLIRTNNLLIRDIEIKKESICIFLNKTGGNNIYISFIKNYYCYGNKIYKRFDFFWQYLFSSFKNLFEGNNNENRM